MQRVVTGLTIVSLALAGAACSRRTPAAGPSPAPSPASPSPSETAKPTETATASDLPTAPPTEVETPRTELPSELPTVTEAPGELSYPTTASLDEYVSVEGEPYSGDVRDVTDDSDSVFVRVPVEWTETDGAASEYGARVYAGDADFESFENNWGVAGVEVHAADVLASSDISDVLDAEGYPGLCEAQERADYDDGVYSGQWDLYTACGADAGSDSVYIVIAAAPADDSYLMIVEIQVPTRSDLPAVDAVVASFQVVPSGNATAPGSDAPPAGDALSFPGPFSNSGFTLSDAVVEAVPEGEGSGALAGDDGAFRLVGEFTNDTDAEAEGSFAVELLDGAGERIGCVADFDEAGSFAPGETRSITLVDFRDFQPEVAEIVFHAGQAAEELPCF